MLFHLWWSWLHHRGPLHIPLWCNSINFNLTGNANGNTKLMPWVNESFAFTHCIQCSQVLLEEVDAIPPLLAGPSNRGKVDYTFLVGDTLPLSTILAMQMVRQNSCHIYGSFAMKYCISNSLDFLVEVASIPPVLDEAVNRGSRTLQPFLWNVVNSYHPRKDKRVIDLMPCLIIVAQ